MKKIDLMLRLLFAVVFVNVSFGQGVYPGGATCETAVPIGIGDGWATAPGTCGPTEWYSFVAPCNGTLIVQNGGPNEVDKRISTGVCGSLVLESTGSWDIASAPAVTLTEGEVAYIEILDSWDCVGQFNVRFSNPACPQPTSLVSFASSFSTADIAWFPGGGESEWTIVYGPSGFDPETEGTSFVWGGGTFATLTGLEELTCYDWYVQANCGGGEVSCFYSGPNTFCTPAICAVPLNLDEDPLTNTEATLTLDPDGSPIGFDYEWGAEGFELGDGTLIVGEPAEFLELTDLTPDSCYDWYARAVCLVDLGAGPEIVYSLWVGPNEFCTDANCIAPTGGTMVASAGLSATLAWTSSNTPSEEEWNIQYGAPGFALGAGVTVTNIPTNPYTLTGLESGTDYCYYVQAVCGEGPDSLSSWSGPYCFTTSIFCEEPSSLFATGTSGTEATLDWELGASEEAWTVSWGPSLADPMDGSFESAAIFPSLGLTGLTPGEDYCYYVRADCGDADPDSSSTWAGPFCWTQPALCATPFNLAAISVTNTAAFINFAAPGGETYDLQWGLPCFEVESGDEIGMVAGTEDKPYYITGLEESTPYWAYVRSTCGVDSVSAWAGPYLFGTQVANDDPCDAEELVLDGPALLRHNFDATILPGEGAIAPGSAGCTDSDGWCSGEGIEKSVWFKFVAPASGQVKVSTFDESECMTNGYTEIAIYSTGSCAIISNFDVEYANTLDEAAEGAPYGSTITACGLTPGQTYYVLVNPLSYIQPNVHFGIALSSVEEISAGLGLSPTICAGSDYDLFDAIAGYSTEDGTWYNPSVAPGNELPSYVGFPDIVGSFDLYYVVGNGCDADTVMTTITTAEGVHAGGDGFYTACNTYDIVLSDHLVGGYDGGGIWMYDGVAPDVALAGGLFTPLAMAPGVYKFLYTVANEYCPTDSAYVTVTLTDCLGLDEEAADALIVYPNPVVDVLTVQNVAIEGNAVIEVLDIEGRVIISNTVSNVFGNFTIDMSTVESGVYFVKVTSDDSVQKVRVVKQ